MRRRHQESARQHQQKVAGCRSERTLFGVPQQCSRADSRLLRVISTGRWSRGHASFTGSRTTHNCHVFALLLHPRLCGWARHHDQRRVQVFAAAAQQIIGIRHLHGCKVHKPVVGGGGWRWCFLLELGTISVRFGIDSQRLQRCSFKHVPRAAACFDGTAVDNQMPDVGSVNLLCNRTESGVGGRSAKQPELGETRRRASPYHVLEVAVKELRMEG